MCGCLSFIPQLFCLFLLQSSVPTQADAHGTTMERQGYWQVCCDSTTIPLSHTLCLFLSFSLCSINTWHSDLRSSATSGTLRWASRFQQTLSSLAWAGAAHREKAKQRSADWSAPSLSSSTPSALFHTTFVLLWHSLSNAHLWSPSDTNTQNA